MRRVAARLTALEQQVSAAGELLAIVVAIDKPPAQVAAEIAALERRLVATGNALAPVIVLDR